VYSATKMLLNGHIQKRRIKCGKPSCRCTKGARHDAHYHVWHLDGRRYQVFVRRDQVPEYVAACSLNRALTATLRAGRAEYKRILRRSREMLQTEKT